MTSADAIVAERPHGALRATLRSTRTPILYLFALDLLMAALHVLGPPLPAWSSATGYNDWVWDLGREGNVPSWYASFQLALVGLLLLAFASVSALRRRSSVVLVLGGLLFLFLSLDEIAGLHEKFGLYLNMTLGSRREASFDRTGPWMVIVTPVFLAAVGLAAWGGRDLLRGQRRAQLLYMAGLVIYVLSFAGLEAVENFVPRSGGWFPVDLVEETGEMVGVTFLLWATYELARSHGTRVVGYSATAVERSRKGSS